MYLRNFGYAFSSVFMSAWSSATSCQRLKSRRTLKGRSELGACVQSFGAALAGVWAGLPAAWACGDGFAWPDMPGDVKTATAISRAAAVVSLQRLFIIVLR